VVLGTGGFLITACEAIPENLRSDVICNCSGIAGEYVIEANVLACSAAYDWFIREFYGMEKIDYGYIEAQLAAQTGVTEALVIPYFKGRGVPDWNTAAKAAFADVTLATTRRELLKAVMEGIFLELKNQVETFRQYVLPERIFASGGLTKSPALGQLLADVMGLPICIRDDKESTAWGAYLIARTGMGDFASVDAAFRALRKEEAATVYEPDAERHALYEKKRARMNAYYRRNQGTE
jgi:sugar (pentulose or hexulose) kinase